jgi:Phage integrase family
MSRESPPWRQRVSHVSPCCAPTADAKRRAARLGLPPIRLHDLRHGWATMALETGEHPKVVAEQLGHASVRVTLDTYSHVTPGVQREAVARVAGRFLDPAVSSLLANEPISGPEGQGTGS